MANRVGCRGTGRAHVWTERARRTLEIMARNGNSAVDMARRLGVAEATVTRELRALGWTSRPRRAWQPPASAPDHGSEAAHA